MKELTTLYTMKETQKFFKGFNHKLTHYDSIDIQQSKAALPDLSQVFKSEIPFIATQESILGIGVNRLITKSNGHMGYKYEFIDTSLLTVEEFDSLLENLIKETLNEDTLKLHRKYTALQHITN